MKTRNRKSTFDNTIASKALGTGANIRFTRDGETIYHNPAAWRSMSTESRLGVLKQLGFA